GCRPRLDGARSFALGHAKLLSRASAQQRAGGLAQQRARGLVQQRAATTQTPRRPIGAGGVRGASRSGSASVITTHALFAREVQGQLRHCVGWFAGGGLTLGQRVGEGAGCWLLGPSCVSPAPQLKREWSPWPEFGWFPANLRDFSKA